MDLSVKIGNVIFQNPVTVASGTFGMDEDMWDIKSLRKLGAFVPKTITLHAQEGNPPPRIHETKAGMLNAIGIENAGVDDFIKAKLPQCKKIGIPIIVSITGKDDEEFETLALRLHQQKGVAAIELNLSCPNLGQETLIAQDSEATKRVVARVKAISSVPVIAKLSPNVTDIAGIARDAESAGADALSLINTFSAMAIDIEKQKPVLGNVTGGLSGPAIKPIALYMVYRAAQKVNIPIIAMGGIFTAEDAVEFLMAGASMVAVGTANFIDPQTSLEVLRGIKDFMKRKKIENIEKLKGSLKV